MMHLIIEQCSARNMASKGKADGTPLKNVHGTVSSLFKQSEMEPKGSSLPITSVGVGPDGAQRTVLISYTTL